MPAPIINDVQTGETPEYPDIQPQRFDASPDEAFAAIRKLAPRQERWSSLEVDEGERRLRAVAKTKLIRFRDDVTIWVVAEGEGGAVHMRSKSRLGKGDFGVNAARIRSFQRQLATALGGGK